MSNEEAEKTMKALLTQCVSSRGAEIIEFVHNQMQKIK